MILNDTGDVPDNRVSRLRTVTGSHVVPGGTRTKRVEGDDESTMAFTAPKYTTFLAGTGLKFVPEIVTLVPIGPADGAKEETLGATAIVLKSHEGDQVLLPISLSALTRQ